MQENFHLFLANFITYFFFNVRNSPHKVFRERKIGKVAWKLENAEKTESAFFLWDFCRTQGHNSVFERWKCIILFLFCSLRS
jgi:hypothetical protein